MASTRSSRWATIIYPDSAQPDFIDILHDNHLNFLLSPIHDSDTNKDGTLKKPHYHLMLYYDSLKSKQQVQELITQIGGVGCELVHSATSYARYLCHLDDPDKCQYNPDDVVAYGLIYSDCASDSDTKYHNYADVIEYIEQNHIKSYSMLLRNLARDNFVLFKAVVDKHTMYRDYLYSRYPGSMRS